MSDRKPYPSTKMFLTGDCAAIDSKSCANTGCPSLNLEFTNDKTFASSSSSDPTPD